MLSWLTLYQEKKGNDMFRTIYASYVTKTDTCQKNVQIGSIIKEDLAKETNAEEKHIKDTDQSQEC